jgi:peroxiredoxin
MSASRLWHLAGFWAFLGLVSLAPVPAVAEDAPINRQVGQRVADFTLRNVLTGEDVRLYGFAGQKQAAVIVFTGTDCPVGNVYMPRLVELAQKYEPQQVLFLAINSNASETAEQVAAHAKEYGVAFPVLKDDNNRIADQLLAERTCEALVLDGRARLRYRGAIDDQYTRRGRKPEAVRSYLVEALDAILAGEDPETTATSVEGCLIERAADADKSQDQGPRVRPAPKSITSYFEEIDKAVNVGPVTYTKDVAPILQAKCQSCHRPGQVAPFSLRSFDEARRWAATLREVVAERRMPPWHADPRYGQFENDRSLTPEQRATLLAWVDQGTPQGDPQDEPPPPTFPEGWIIGTPDIVLEMPEEYVVPSQGTVAYQHFRVKTNFTEDTWVQAAEAQPGDRSVVHHIIAYVVPGQGRLEEGVRGGHLCGYAPGEMPSIYAPGTAKLIPAGSDIIFQVHYTPIGKVRTDRSKVGLILAKQPVTRRAFTHGIANPRFAIPAGDPNHEVRSQFQFPVDAELIAFMPHMHLRGKDFLYEVTYPGQTEREILLSVPAYDFGWQSYYRHAQPKPMPKGTRIDCTAHFDNSDTNPYNPDPSQTVRWGDQTWEEMMIGYIDYSVKLSDVPPTPAARPSAASTLLRALQRAGQRSPERKPD